MTSAFALCLRASTGWRSDYAANWWYSWMSPPSTLRRAMLARGDATVVCPRHRRLETEAPMWPVLVVVPDVLGERPFQVTTPEDEGPVQALSPYGPNEALA